MGYGLVSEGSERRGDALVRRLKLANAITRLRSFAYSKQCHARQGSVMMTSTSYSMRIRPLCGAANSLSPIVRLVFLRGKLVTGTLMLYHTSMQP